MNQKFLVQQKELLEKEKAKIESQLGSFARKDEQDKGGWASKMPVFNNSTGNLEEEADEVEEFGMRLTLEGTLEEELRKINDALENIKKKKYGICEKCGKEIAKERLAVYPQAEFCQKCQ